MLQPPVQNAPFPRHRLWHDADGMPIARAHAPDKEALGIGTQTRRAGDSALLHAMDRPLETHWERRMTLVGDGVLLGRASPTARVGGMETCHVCKAVCIGELSRRRA